MQAMTAVPIQNLKEFKLGGIKHQHLVTNKLYIRGKLCVLELSQLVPLVFSVFLITYVSSCQPAKICQSSKCGSKHTWFH